MGLQAIMHTIIMGKMEIVLPDMYIINRFIGICFRGPRATSQHLWVVEKERVNTQRPTTASLQPRMCKA
uniref:Uncharacterized protein n=1 Tax=Paramormyrops kingsleyae TaxID=1676925 RepID=A0A3B3SJ09_9TELE